MPKLEIGAGSRPTPGYVHQDIRPLLDIEYVCDARALDELCAGMEFEEIRACHVLEHFGRNETVEILEHWASFLRVGGVVHIEVPNFDWQARAYSDGRIGAEEAVYFVYGEQDYPENTHKTGFTEETLQQALEDAGLETLFINDIGQVLVAQGKRVADE